jgi:hypothetical protein
MLRWARRTGGAAEVATAAAAAARCGSGNGCGIGAGAKAGGGRHSSSSSSSGSRATHSSDSTSTSTSGRASCDSPFVLLTHSGRSFQRRRRHAAAAAHTHLERYQQLDPPTPLLQFSSYPSNTTTTTTTNLCLEFPPRQRGNTILNAAAQTSTTFRRNVKTALFSFKRPFHTTAIMAETQWPAHRVRQTFFEYFEEKGHTLGTPHATNHHHHNCFPLPPPKKKNDNNNSTVFPYPCSPHPN